MSRRWSSRESGGNSSDTPLPGSGAGPAFRSAASATALAVQALTITKPAGTALNDVLVACITYAGTDAADTAPAGWTVILRNPSNSNTYQQTLWWKRATGAEPANYTFNFPGAVPVNKDAAGAICAYTGIVTAGNPVNDSETTENVGQSTIVTAQGVDAATAGSELICFFGKQPTVQQAYTFTAPAGEADRVNISTTGNTLQLLIADELFSAGGESNGRTASYTPSDIPTAAVGSMITLTPAVTGGGVTFMGSAEEVGDYSAIRIFIDTDVASAPNGLELQWSRHGSGPNANFITLDQFTIDPGKRSEIVPIRAGFFRLKYTNDGVAQTRFHLQTVLIPETDQSTPRQERFPAYTATASLAAGTLTTILTTTAAQSARAVEVWNWGVSFDVTGSGQAIPATSANYYMELFVGGVLKQSAVVRNDSGPFIPCRITTDGGTILIKIRHDVLLTTLPFRATLQVRELI